MFYPRFKVEFKAKRHFKNKYRSSSYQEGLKGFLLFWLTIYGACVLISIARPIAFFIISGFEMPPTYEVELVNALKMSLYWLLPTLLLLVAIRISKWEKHF